MGGETAFSKRLSPEEEIEAFIKDREEHLEKKVIPALEKGNIVILDRYFYSTIAYQGIRCDDLTELENMVTATVLVPDAAFVLDLDARIAALRITDRDGKPNEFEKLDDQILIREIFLKLDKQHSQIMILDGNMSVGVLHHSIVNLLIDGTLKDKRCFKDYGCDEPVYCGYGMTDMCDWRIIRDNLRKRLAVQTNEEKKIALIG